MKQETRNKRQERQAGFTLIEILLYAAITTFLLAFAIITVYQLLDNVNRGKYERELAENQKFLEQKIIWALTGVSAITTPAADATSTSLLVTKIGYGSNPVLIDSSGPVARIQKAGGSYYPLTSYYSTIQSLYFHQFSWDGRPAVHITGTLVNPLASTTATIDTTILTK